MACYQENISSSPAFIKYGELFVLGYHGFPPNGDEAWRKRHFALCQRTKANGVKLSTVHIGCNTQATKALSISDQHRISYTVSQMGQVSTVVVEYACDSNTDMFQIGRSKERPNDIVLTAVPDSHSLSRFACRIVCQRSPPYAARIYAAGFDSAKNIFLGQDAVKWKTHDGQMDGLTTNGVLVMHPPHGFTKDYGPGLWREISVCGNVFTVRETCSPQQRGWMVPSESQELVDGSLIDLCGVTLLWRTAEGLAHMPTMGHLEVQRQEIYAERPCFVYKAKKDGAGILKDPPRVSSVSHPCERISPGNTNRKVKDFFKRFPVQDSHPAVPRSRVPQDSHPAVPRDSCPLVPTGSPNRKVKDFFKRFTVQDSHPAVPRSRVPQDSHPAVPRDSCPLVPPGSPNRKVKDFFKRFTVQDSHPAVPRSRVPQDSHLAVPRSRVPQDSHPAVPRSRVPQDSHPAVPRSRVPQDSHPAVPRSRVPQDSHLAVPRDSRPLVPPGRPNRKVKDFLKHAHKLTLDPNTAHVKISLSENNRKVTRVEGEPKYPDHADRFKDYGQVMCRESLTGRCYWEVEWSGEVEIAVTYRGINRKGDASQFGYNDKSWSLRCSGDDNSYTAWHNKKKTDLPVSPSSRSGRVAVYVDHSSGTVSFYKLCSDTLTHLHSFQAKFTEHLYAGFWVGWTESSVSVFQRHEVQ